MSTPTDLPVKGNTKYSVAYGQTEISYSIKTSDRQTLAIHVYPNGDVEVDAPKSASYEAIADKVKKRASWIFKQKLQFESYPLPLTQRQYVSGETYRYLGRQYRLLVKQGEVEYVKLTQGRLVVNTKKPENAVKIRQLVQSWYYSKAQRVFFERYNLCICLVGKLNIQHNQGFQLRFMPKRWGSCTGHGHILLNPELIAAPKDCIDYVITHELCHVKEHNHSPKFYSLLASVMSDWESRKKRLNETVEVRFI